MEKENISVTFWLLNDKEHIFSWYPQTYPSYRIGDTIWLESKKAPLCSFPDIRELPLAKYTIVDMQYKLTKHWGPELTNYVEIGVYIKEVE